LWAVTHLDAKATTFFFKVNSGKERNPPQLPISHQNTARFSLRYLENTLIPSGCLVQGMDVIFNFNYSWFILFFAFLGAWAALLVARRKWNAKYEVKEQVFLAFGGMISLALMEFFAVSTGLWNYTPGNWPVILWPTYFAAILFGYQMLRSIEGLLRRNPVL
jgi:hypothetical protein